MLRITGCEAGSKTDTLDGTETTTRDFGLKGGERDVQGGVSLLDAIVAMPIKRGESSVVLMANSVTVNSVASMMGIVKTVKFWYEVAFEFWILDNMTFYIIQIRGDELCVLFESFIDNCCGCHFGIDW